MHYPGSIKVREVSPRDGLQGEQTVLSTANKVQPYQCAVGRALSADKRGVFREPQSDAPDGGCRGSDGAH